MKRHEKQIEQELKDIKKALDESTVIAITDADGVITYVNDKFCETSKYSREELIGQTHRIVKSDYHPTEFFREMWETISSGKIWHGEIKNKAKDGSFYWVSTTIVPFLDDNGKPHHYIAVRHNITDCKIAEEKLREAHDQITEIFNSTTDCFYSLDYNLHFNYVNLRMLRYFGMREEDFLGRFYTDVLPKMRTHEVFFRHQKALSEQKPEHFEFLSPMTGKWIDLHIFPSTKGLSVYFRDITESKLAQEQLRESEERFRSTFENAAVGIAHAAPNGDWLIVNERLCEITGYTREELLSRNFQNITHPDDIGKDLEFMRRILAGELDVFSLEKRYICKDKSVLWIHLTVSAKRDRNGAVEYFIAVVQDINERKKSEEKLRDSEVKYRVLFEQNPFPVFVFDSENHQILAFNEASVKLYGYSREELLTMTVKDLRPPEDVSDYLELMKRINKLDIAHSIQAKHRKKNGEIIHVELSSYRMVYEGHPARYVILMDVTERNRLAAAAAREQQEKIDILENINDAFISLDRDWRFTFVNPAAEKNLRRKADELLGKRVWDEFPRAVGTKFDIEYHRAMETGENVFFEEYYPPLESWLEVNAYPSENGLAVFYRDITGRKLAEQLISEKNQLLEQTYDAIFIWNIDDGIIYWNQNAERLYGYTEKEALGQESHELLKTVYPHSFPVFVEEIKQKGFWEGELIHTTKAGEEVIVEGRMHVIRRDGSNIMVFETLRDVTERKQLENKLSRAAQLSLVGELAAGLAHEIKNPLAGIKGVIDIILQRRSSDNTEREILESVQHQIERIDKTVRELLRQSRPKPLEVKMASLNETVRRAVQFASHKTSAKHTSGGKISTKLNLPKSLVLIPHDSAGIEGAVMNLILNAQEAVKHKENGKIAVRLAKYKSPNGEIEVLIEVSDNGCGIPKEKLEQIFMPFYTTHENGTGLGLAAVKRIARAHGGNCEVRSIVGKGSTFTIRLPYDSDAAQKYSFHGNHAK